MNECVNEWVNERGQYYDYCHAIAVPFVGTPKLSGHYIFQEKKYQMRWKEEKKERMKGKKDGRMEV